MNRAEVEQEVVRLLRQSALLGSEREVSPDEPLVESGLGLDSLALVEFLAALEKSFGIDFPDDIWTEREQLTLRYLSERILLREVAAVPPTHERAPSREQILAAERSRWAKLGAAIRERGLVLGLAWAASRLLLRAVKLFYERRTFMILERDLTGGPVATHSASLPLVLGSASPRHLAALPGFGPRSRQKEYARRVKRRFESGFMCLAAWHQGLVVGIDWLSPSGDDDRFTGLKTRMSPGACLGLDLREHQDYAGKGIGLALLTFSLSEAQRLGYQRQFTLVLSDNTRMLGAATHLLGFRKIGEVHTTRFLGRTFAKWQVAGRFGRGRTFQL